MLTARMQIAPRMMVGNCILKFELARRGIW
jgi:hypothetical protein